MAGSLLDSIAAAAAAHASDAERIIASTADSSNLADQLCALVLRTVGRSAAWADALRVLLNASVPGCCADLAAALALKDAGNAAFAAGDVRRAADLYSDALAQVDEARHAPDAAKLYNNRALCWLRLRPAGAPAAAAADAGLALALCDAPAGAGAGTRAKALHRLAAAAVAGAALAPVAGACGAAGALEAARPGHESREAAVGWAGPGWAALPPGVRVEVTPREGRALAAARELAPGQVAFAEARPWASVLLRPHRKTVRRRSGGVLRPTCPGRPKCSASACCASRRLQHLGPGLVCFVGKHPLRTSSSGRCACAAPGVLELPAHAAASATGVRRLHAGALLLRGLPRRARGRAHCRPRVRAAVAGAAAGARGAGRAPGALRGRRAPPPAPPLRTPPPAFQLAVGRSANKAQTAALAEAARRWPGALLRRPQPLARVAPARPVPAREALAARLRPPYPTLYTEQRAQAEAAGRPAPRLEHHLGKLAAAAALPRAAAACLAAACASLPPGRVLEALCRADANALAVVPPAYARRAPPRGGRRGRHDLHRVARASLPAGGHGSSWCAALHACALRCSAPYCVPIQASAAGRSSRWRWRCMARLRC